ncbi:MAG: hypothetical protein Fur0024_2690 [Patescibacteria group bacterium]
MDQLLIIHGDDDFRIPIILKREISKRKSSGFSVSKIDFASETFSQNYLIQSMESGLFSEKKVLVFENLFKSKFSEKEELKIIEILKNGIKNLSNDIQIIIFELFDISKLSEKTISQTFKNFFSFLQKKFKVQKINLLSKDEIVKKIYAIANTEYKIKTPLQIAEKIVEFSGFDLATSLNNIKILASFKMDSGEILEKDLENLNKISTVEKWDFSKKIFADNRTSLLALEKQIDSGFEPHALWGSVLSEIARLMLISISKNPEDFGIHQYAFSNLKKILQNKKFNLEKVFALGKKLDLELKSTSANPKSVLQDFLISVDL